LDAILHSIRIDAMAIDLYYFRRRVDRDDPVMSTGKLFGPQAGAACDFQHVAGRKTLRQRGANDLDLPKPLLSMSGAAVVSTFAQKPLVVLGRSCPVVVALFPKNVVHRHTVAAHVDRRRRSRQPSAQTHDLRGPSTGREMIRRRLAHLRATAHGPIMFR